MKILAHNIDNKIEPLRQIATKVGAPLLDLGMRAYMAKIFFTSGLLKFGKFRDEGWEGFIVPFEEYYPIPGVAAGIAAPMATAAELILPILLVFGLFSRFAAIGLLIMTLTIQYIVPAEYGLANVQHYFWMFLLASIALKGAGALSIDHFLVKWASK